MTKEQFSKGKENVKIPERSLIFSLIIFITGIALATSCGLDSPRFKTWQELRISLFYKTSRPALEPSQPPIR